MLINTVKKKRLSLPNKTSLGIYTGYGGVSGFTRATTKTCLGYLENALPGDSQYILTIPSGIPCFPGLRFIASTNSWSDKYANGVAINVNGIGISIEPQRTNLISHSANFTNWQFYNCDPPSESGVSKYGTLYKIMPNTSNANHGVYQLNKTVIQTNKYCLWCIAKAGELAGLQISGTENDLSNYRACFNLNTGTVHSTGSQAVPFIKNLSDGFYIIGIIVTAPDTTADFRIYVCPVASLTSNGAISPHIGNNNDGLYLVQAQLEEGEYPTSIIITSSTSVTRNADIQTIKTEQNINRYQGSLSFEFTPTHNAAGTVALGGSYVDANNYTQILHIAGTGYIFRKRISGVNYDATLSGDFVADTTYQVEIKWSTQNGTDIFVNGVKGTNNPDTKPLQLGATWQIGADANSGQQAGACFKNVLTKYK